MGGGSQEAPGEGKGVHAPARPVESRAPRAPMGAHRKELYLRGRGWKAVTAAYVRWTWPAGDLSRNVQSGYRRAKHDLDRRRCVLCVFLVDGQLQRHHRPLEPPRYHDGGHITSPVSGDCSIQETHGLV